MSHCFVEVGNVGDKEWYFFCIRGRKYRNSVRPNRVTGSGFWKATGIDKPIYSAKEPHGCVGLKKSLVYYRGSAGKGTKTDWMMHEFRLPPNPKSSHDSNFANHAKLNNNNNNNNNVNAADLEAVRISSLSDHFMCVYINIYIYIYIFLNVL